jgi:hypothetical protein
MTHSNQATGAICSRARLCTGKHAHNSNNIKAQHTAHRNLQRTHILSNAVSPTVTRRPRTMPPGQLLPGQLARTCTRSRPQSRHAQAASGAHTPSVARQRHTLPTRHAGTLAPRTLHKHAHRTSDAFTEPKACTASASPCAVPTHTPAPNPKLRDAEAHINRNPVRSIPATSPSTCGSPGRPAPSRMAISQHVRCFLETDDPL